MKVLDNTPVRLAAAGTALICVLAGCSKSNEEPSSSSSASASSTTSAAMTTAAEAEPAANDYSSLLMAVEDIDAPEPFIAEPPKVNPNGPDGMQGVEAMYHNADNTAMIKDSIAVFATPAEATEFLNKVATDLPASTVMGTAETSPFGSDGVLVPGTSPDGTKAVTVLMFTEQNAVVELEFESPPGDLNPAPADFVRSVGQLQFDAIQAGLPDITPPAPAAAGAVSPVVVNVDGKPLNVQGQVVCATNDGKYSIAVGDMATGIIVGLEPDASVVHNVGLGTVDGVVMSFTEGVPGNTATATKNGNTYNITGAASGVSEANPAEQITKPFSITVTCP
jgi:Mycobacterium 19 kDa lipoprotein antigen